jgi:hypothetical protein
MKPLRTTLIFCLTISYLLLTFQCKKEKALIAPDNHNPCAAVDTNYLPDKLWRYRPPYNNTEVIFSSDHTYRCGPWGWVGCNTLFTMVDTLRTEFEVLELRPDYMRMRTTRCDGSPQNVGVILELDSVAH